MIMTFFSGIQIFSSSMLQKKFNELLNRLLGSYTKSIFFPKEKQQEAIPDYVVFDLDIKNTIGVPTFIVNEKNISRIISEIDRINSLKILFLQFNNKLKKVEVVSKARALVSRFQPYLYPKKNIKENLNNKKLDIKNKIQEYIIRINKISTIRLQMIEHPGQLKISWDPKTNDLLYSKILILTMLYTLFESLKPLVAEEKKLSIIHKKWETIESIRNIGYSDDILIAQKKLEKIVEEFSKKIANDLDTRNNRAIQIKDFLLTTFVAFMPQILFGAVQSSVYSSIVNIINAKIPNTLQDLVKNFLKKEVSLFSNTEQNDEFTTFVYKNDEIEEKLVNIFTFIISDDAKIVLKEKQEKIKNFNDNVNSYLRYCLLPYDPNKSIAINSFDSEKNSEQFRGNFYDIKKELEMLSELKIEKSDGVFYVDTTDVYKKQNEIGDLLGSLDEKTRDVFEDQIKEIFGKKQDNDVIVKDLEKIKSEAKMVLSTVKLLDMLDETVKDKFSDRINEIFKDQQKNFEQKLIALNSVKLNIELIMEDSKIRDAKIIDLERLLLLLDENEKVTYTKKLTKIKKQNFITLEERSKVINDLTTLESNIKGNIEPQTLSLLQKTGEKVAQVFGLISDQEKEKLKRFIQEQYNIIEQAIQDVTEKKASLTAQIAATKKRFLQSADDLKMLSSATKLKSEVAEKINTLGEKIGVEKIIQIIESELINLLEKNNVAIKIQNKFKTNIKDIIETIDIDLSTKLSEIQKLKDILEILMNDIGKRTILINEIQKIINEKKFSKSDKYVKEFAEIKKIKFIDENTHDERNIVLEKLEKLKNNLKFLPEIKPQQSSRTERLKSWFGWE